MIYALASYSVTFGALGLYWAFLAHRRRALADAVARAAGQPTPAPASGLNLGALLLAPLWMIAHGMRVMGALLLVPWLASVPLALAERWVPFVFVAAIPLAAGAALARVGNGIAAARGGHASAAAVSATQLPWALGGIALYTIVLPWAIWFGLLAD